MRVHDQVVASQRYRDTFQLAADVAQRAQQTWLYSKARATLPGPLVETGEPGGQAGQAGQATCPAACSPCGV